MNSPGHEHLSSAFSFSSRSQRLLAIVATAGALGGLPNSAETHATPNNPVEVEFASQLGSFPSQIAPAELSQASVLKATFNDSEDNLPPTTPAEVAAFYPLARQVWAATDSPCLAIEKQNFDIKPQSEVMYFNDETKNMEPADGLGFQDGSCKTIILNKLHGARLCQVVLHEVGHTVGKDHDVNDPIMAASTDLIYPGCLRQTVDKQEHTKIELADIALRDYIPESRELISKNYGIDDCKFDASDKNKDKSNRAVLCTMSTFEGSSERLFKLNINGLQTYEGRPNFTYKELDPDKQKRMATELADRALKYIPAVRRISKDGLTWGCQRDYKIKSQSIVYCDVSTPTGKYPQIYRIRIKSPYTQNSRPNFSYSRSRV